MLLLRKRKKRSKTKEITASPPRTPVIIIPVVIPRESTEAVEGDSEVEGDGSIEDDRVPEDNRVVDDDTVEDDRAVEDGDKVGSGGISDIVSSSHLVLY